MAAKFSGGYSVEVIHDNDKERFKCMLCLDIIKSATHGCMNHVFCKECINDYIESNKKNKKLRCPAGCGISFNKDKLQSNNPIDQFIKQIACKCPDCSWKGELYDFVEHHELNCEEKKVLCRLCNEFIKKKVFEKHASETCPGRERTCKHCTKNIRYFDLASHEDLCGNVDVECMYKKFGCLKKVKRSSQDSHNAQNSQMHLVLVSEYFMKENNHFRSAIENLVTENAVLKKSFQSMLSSHKEIMEALTQLRKENSELTDRLSSVTLKLVKTLLTEHSSIKDFAAIKENGSLLLKQTWFELEHLKKCFYNKDFMSIIAKLIEFNDLTDFKYELESLISSSSSIMFRKVYGCMYVLIFKVQTFETYEDDEFSLNKIGGKYYFKFKSFIEFPHTLLLSKWKIDITEDPIDTSKPDKRFKSLSQPYTLDYGCLWI